MYNTYIYIAVMAVTTYLIRMLPFTVFRRKIRSRFLRSFFSYVPYAVLGAMVLPYIFYSTGDVRTAVVGFAAAGILSYMKLPLIVVALAACCAAFAAGLVL